jgi:hypothetical protein
VRDILKKLAPALRAAGFRGSGQNWRKTDGDFRLIINFQGSPTGDKFYVNLGAQPIFIPPECDADLSKLKEYECILRTRVGRERPWDLSEVDAAALEAEILAAQKSFFGHASTLRAALAKDDIEVLIEKFSAGTTRARATLYLARAAAALGHRARALELVERGLDLAGDAYMLRADLQRIKQQF